MHIVDKALEKIMKNSKIYGTSLDISDYDFKVARLAALLHDVGHYPFSHALDGVIPNKHEQYSIGLIKNRFAEYIEHKKIKTKDVIQLIEGKAPLKKPFLNSLIDSQLDVDKFDYLLRDSYFAGVKYGIFDLDRLLDSLFVVDNDLVVLIKGYYAAELLIIARYHMFEQLYYHHTKRAFENMAKIAAIRMITESNFNYPSPNDLEKKSKMSEFAHVDDKWFLSRIGGSSNAACKRIATQIEKRIPYKVIVDSEQIRTESGEKEDSKGGSGFVRAVEENVTSNLKKIKISMTDIIFDKFENIPYRLRPYSRAYAENAEEPDAVLIYDQDIDSKEPIENKSFIVKTLANNLIRKRRIYVEESKKALLLDFLRKSYPHSLR